MHVALCQRQIAIDGRGGGLGTLYANLAEAMAGAGAAVTVVTATEPAAVGVAGVDIISIPQPSPDPAVYAGQVDAALAALDIDLAECASWKAELAVYAARAARAPVVVRGELPGPVLALPEKMLALERALMQRADAVLPVSRTVADLIEQYYERRADAIVHNAVDTRIFHPGEPRRANAPMQALWVGSHAPIKRIDHLETIIERAAGWGAFDVVLPWRDGDDAIARLAAYPHVTLHHNVTQEGMTRLYRRADVLVSTSRLEAFGLGVLEAMACGAPVLIPRDIGGPTEFVRSGADGYYYDSLDDAVDKLTETDWRGFDAKGMVAWAQRFSWARCVENTLAAYAKLLP